MGIWQVFKEGFKEGYYKSKNDDYTIQTNTLTADKNDKADITAVNKEYQKTIFLYSQEGSPIKDNGEYPRYILYNLGITNPKMFHEEMVKEGYLKKADIYQVLSNLKVTDLKEILTMYNLPKKGKKEQLIDTILLHVPKDYLDRLQNQSALLTLSDKGAELLKEYNDYIKLYKHSSWGITLSEYHNAKDKLTFNGSFYDIVWSIFNKKLIESSIYEKRNIFFNMYNLLKEENKNEQALYFLLVVFYNDLSGINNYHNIEFYLQYKKERIYTKKDILEYSRDFMFAPGVLEMLVLLKEYYSEDMVDKIYATYKLPINCCPIDMFKKIINELYTTPSLNVELYTKKLNNNYKKIVKGL